MDNDKTVAHAVLPTLPHRSSGHAPSKAISQFEIEANGKTTVSCGTKSRSLARGRLGISLF